MWRLCEIFNKQINDILVFAFFCSIVPQLVAESNKTSRRGHSFPFFFFQACKIAASPLHSHVPIEKKKHFKARLLFLNLHPPPVYSLCEPCFVKVYLQQRKPAVLKWSKSSTWAGFKPLTHDGFWMFFFVVVFSSSKTSVQQLAQLIIHETVVTGITIHIRIFFSRQTLQAVKHMILCLFMWH